MLTAAHEPQAAVVQEEPSRKAGRLCLPPLLLAGVLPHEGPGAVLDLLSTLCHDQPQGPAWASQYPQAQPRPAADSLHWHSPQPSREAFDAGLTVL